MAKRKLTVTTGVMILLVVTACSGDRPPQPPEEIRQDTMVAATSRPEITIRMNSLATECMRGRGYDIPAEPAPATPRNVSMLGFVDFFASPEEAAVVGYTSTIKEAAPSPVDAARAALPAEDHATFDIARLGDPSDASEIVLANGSTLSRSRSGCEGAAAAAVFGSVEDALEVDALQNDVLILATDEVIQRALSEVLGSYQKCMREAGIAVKGFNVSSLVGATFGKYRTASSPPNGEESRIAARDASCQKEAEVNAAAMNAFFSASQRWLTDNAERVKRVASIVQRASSSMNSG